MIRGEGRGDPRRSPEEPDLDRILAEIAPWLGSLRRRLGGGFGGLLLPGFLVLVVLWLGSGVYIVGPAERGVVRQFGAFVGLTEPGPQYHLPWPVQQVDMVNVAEVRRMELGFRTTDRGSTRMAVESRMITGDENIVEVEMIVQYRIAEPEKYLFKVWDPEGTPDRRTLRDAAEAALRLVVGQRAIDDVLTVEKGAVQEETKLFLQELMNSYRAGILIDQVRLQDVQPPQPVQAAFKDVVSAKEDKERLVNQAKGYEQDIIPKARGEAERILREAEAFREQHIRQAQGDASRFLAVLREYAKAKEVTRRRLYLEMIEDVFPDVRKFIVDPQAGGNLLQLLPLQGAAAAAAAEAPAPAPVPRAVPSPAPAPAPVPGPAAPSRR